MGKKTLLKITALFSLNGPVYLGCLLLLLAVPSMADNRLDFEQLYGKFSVTGLEFSNKVKTMAGKQVVMRGFMAPPLKAESQFFVLTKTPMALCPFCSSDADWPEDILVVYLQERQTFVQYNAAIEVEGRLEYGSWTDPETGFVSQLRLRNAVFRPL
ncbi:hypothetical protein EDC45_0061 [Mesocricetibacter intestinalis]|uniref:DUF3299 domain-containing protein n=1 Tax=Mesocricetibacter intestinalis TaxID=1521930 RepID=A0A4R6VC06_9PAST|nr:hypothetical protein [Mesocricetibacter intestinalis]TDQ59414.1 hypothetical protein EDC45_0061 [Mesocricetibacter intestinalis]